MKQNSLHIEINYIVKISPFERHIINLNNNNSLVCIFKATWRVSWKKYWILSFTLKPLCEKGEREKEFTEMY